MAEGLSRKNLRIAIIDPIGQKAGMDHYDISLARAMKEKGCIVNVYSNFLDTGGSAEKIFDFSFNENIFRYLKLAVNYLSTLVISKREKTEIVILHNFHSFSIDYLFTRLAKILGFKVCVIVHDVESFISRNKKSWIKRIVTSANHVIVHNKTSYYEIIKKIRDIDKSKIEVVPHGNYLTLPIKIQRSTALNKFNLDANKRYILFFGMIKKSKGLEILIEAMRDVQKEIHLIIAGRTRDAAFSEYQNRINNLGLDMRVHSYVRYITNEERNLLFNIADIVVTPYHKIYQSGVMLLAMSYGVPVIASELPSNIFDKADILLFKPGNSADLASKINSLIKDDERRRLISKSSIEYVKLQHNWDNIAGSFIRILN